MQTQKSPIPILMYHRIADKSSEQLSINTVTSAMFAEHMAYLNDHHYRTVTVTQLVQILNRGIITDFSKLVALTFDDAFADFYSDALPLIKRHNFVATLYIPTAYVGTTSRWLLREGGYDYKLLDWSQIAEISAHGIECGSHSETHAQLDTLPPAVARREIWDSKRIIEDHIYKDVHTFCYPYGYYNRRVRSLVVEAGYNSACAVKFAMSSRLDDSYALARIHVTNRINSTRLADLLQVKRFPIAPKQERLRTQVRMFLRRWFGRIKYELKVGSVQDSFQGMVY